MASESGSFDETIKVNTSAPAEDSPASTPPHGGTVSDETVKIERASPPFIPSPPLPREGETQAVERDVAPPTPVYNPDTQPTVRVTIAPISETQPTVPVLPPTPVEEATVKVPAPPPIALASTHIEPPPFIRRGAGFSLSSLSGWHAIAAGGIGILLLLACIGLYLSVGKDMASIGPIQLHTRTPTPTATPTRPPATPTLPPSPTLPPTQTPRPVTPTPAVPVATSTVKPPPTALEVGVLAKVTPPEGSPLNVRSTASIGGEKVGTLQSDAEVKIVDGPVEANELTWWKIDDGAGLIGWSAAGSGGETYLTPLGWAP